MVTVLATACSERPKSDVCRLKDELSAFLCATSRADIGGGNYRRQSSFYISDELGMRAIPNLAEILSGLSGSEAVLFVGGSNPNQTISTIGGAIAKLTDSNLRLNGATIVFVGSRSESEIVAPHFQGLGAKYVLLEE